MKRFILVLALVGILSPMVAWTQQTYVYPTDKPIFSVTFPAKWSSEVLEESVITANSPDESIAMMIWKLPEGLSQEQAIEILDEQLSTMLNDISLEEPSINTINGLKMLQFDGTAQIKEDNVDVSVAVIFFKPEGRQNFSKTADFFVQDSRADFIWVYFGTPDGEKRYAKDLEKIINSIKKK